MSFQRKLYPCFDQDFWKRLPVSISYMVRDLITGRDIGRLVQALKEAGITKCSESLLYKWANPSIVDALPSLMAFLLLVKLCENCEPIESINAACGKIGVPDDDLMEGMKFFMAEFEKRARLRGPQAGTPAPLRPEA
jgi:hypothetical protein